MPLVSIGAFSSILSWEVLDFLEDNHSLLDDRRQLKIVVDHVVQALPRRSFKIKDVPLSNFSREVKNSVASLDLTFKVVIDIITFDNRYDTLLKITIQGAEISLKE